MSPILSVIMPVYNGAAYLKSTLRNLIYDGLNPLSADDWELIIVNDGSTDGSPEIIEQSTKGFKNIKVIDQKNGGASTARNVGLKAASGDFVYFIDSDDLILKGAFLAIVNAIKTYHPDLIKFQLRHISSEEYDAMKEDVPQAEISESDFKILSPKDFLSQTEAMTNPIGDCTVLTVYSRELLLGNSIVFNPEIYIGEDVDLIWRTMFEAKTICYIPLAFYLYHIHDNGVSRNEGKRRQILVAYHNLLDNMLSIRERYSKRADLVSSGADAGLRNTIRFLTNYVLSQQIIGGESLSAIYRTMHHLKRAGADIHPGRPRFERAVAESASAKAKIRRWFVAYILVIPIWLMK